MKSVTLRRIVGMAMMLLLYLGMGCMRVGPVERVVSRFSASGAEGYPLPTEIAQLLESKDERRDFKRRRTEWIENMHFAAPGTDWRVKTEQTRLTRATQRHALREQRLLQDQMMTSRAVVESQSPDVPPGVWIERGSKNLAGRMHTADVDQARGLIYVGSSGGNIWVGSLAGQNWRSLNDSQQMNNISMVRLLPNGDSQRLVVLSKKYVYYTENEGLTWQTATGLENVVDWGDMRRGVVFNGTQKRIYVLTNEWDNGSWRSVRVLFVSTDLGASFTPLATFTDSASEIDLWASPRAASGVFITIGESCHRIEADGTMTPLGTAQTDLDIGSVTRTLMTGSVGVSPTTLFVARTVDGTTHFSRSTDAGASWDNRGTLRFGAFMSNSFECSRKNPQNVYFGGVDCYRSADGAQNWTKVSDWYNYYNAPETKLHADIPGINSFIDALGNEFTLINTDGGTYISRDQIRTVQNLSLSGLGVSQYYSVYTNREQPQIIFAGAQDQGMQRTLLDAPGTLDFEQIISGDYGHIVSSDGGKSIWTVYPGFALWYPQATTNDNIYTWDFEGSGYLWLPPIMEDPALPNVAWWGGGSTGSGVHLWKITAKPTNDSLSAVEGTFDFSGGTSGNKISAMSYSLRQTQYRYVLTSQGDFYHSSDNGTNWTKTQSFTGPGSHYFYGSTIVASATIPGRVYIGGSGYSNPAVYVSNNHGATFQPLVTGLPDTLVFQLAEKPGAGQLFAATDVGPYIYQETTGTWTDLAGTDAPEQSYWSVEYVPAINTARFSTYGRGIWDYKMSPSNKTGALMVVQ